MQSAPHHHGDVGAPRNAVVGALGDEGLRVLVDADELAQAVYLYRPVLEGDRVIDLEIEWMNEAAHRVPLSSGIREGVRASEVFVDTEKALVAAATALHVGRAPRYEIERRGFVDGQPTIVSYEVSTYRLAGHVVQLSVDRSTVLQLASADARFHLMADASSDGLVLLARETEPGDLVVVYANPAAVVEEPSIRLGRPLVGELDAIARRAIGELTEVDPVRRRLVGAGVSRRVEREVSFTTVAGDQVMMTIHHLTHEGEATVDLERSERVLAAIGSGAFGTIVVFEPRWSAGRLVDLELLWQSRRPTAAPGAATELDPASVIPLDDLVTMARDMLGGGEHQRSGWVQVDDATDGERSIEFTLVFAGDRVVLEFVERTEELAARTALAMVTATSEAQRTFLSRVSHEMRSPLNVIHGYSQLLGRLQLPAGAAEHVTRIEEGVERMVQIVDDLLLLGQLDQGLLRLDAQLVDLGDVVGEIVDAAAHQSWWRPDALRRATVPAGATVRTDRARLVTVGQLLVQASIEPSLGGPVDDAVEIGPFVRGTRVGLQFSAPSSNPVVEEVWRPFAERHVLPGAGLGLAVARGLVQALDATVEMRTSGGRSALVLLFDPVGDPLAESSTLRG